MDSVELNIIAIVAAVMVYHVMGAIWYSPLVLGPAWQRSIGITETGTGNSVSALATGTAGSVVAAIVLAVIVDWSGAEDAAAGSLVGLIIGAGLVGFALLLTLVYEQRSVTTFLIGFVYQVLGFAAMGAILGGWT